MIMILEDSLVSGTSFKSAKAVSQKSTKSAGLYRRDRRASREDEIKGSALFFFCAVLFVSCIYNI
jgi:hypothetical protein